MKHSAVRHSNGTVSAAAEPQNAEIPDKLYFPIREAAEIIGVEPYVLRFWEKEFPTFHPTKAGSGHRRYRKKDVELGLEIKRLLYQQGFTIEGARNQLKKAKTVRAATAPKQQRTLPFSDIPAAALGKIRRELSDILTMLSKPGR
jgi:DNA-binding transcriptional MerR regulator